MPFRCLVIALLGGTLLSLPSISFAQDTLFDTDSETFPGDAEELFGPGEQQPAAETEPEPTTETDDPVVQQLLAAARRGPQSRASAIASLARMGHWSEVDRLLSEAASQQHSDSELAAMGESIDPVLLLKIATNDRLSDAARQFAHSMAKAASSEQQSAPRLEKAIEQLAANSIDARLSATRTLLNGDEASIRALVDALVSPQPTAAPRDDLLRVLLRLGKGGEQALKQIALYGKPPQQLRSLNALIRIGPESCVSELLTALHASDSSDQQRQLAASAIKSLVPAPPTREEAIRYLYDNLQTLRRTARTSDSDAQTATLWSIDAQRTGVEPQKTRRTLVRWRRAADAAARLRRIGQLPPKVSQTALLADVGYRVALDPEWDAPSQVQSLRNAYPAATHGEELSAAIGQAFHDRDWPAVIGLVRLVGPELPPDQQDALLHGTSPEPAPLVQAASASDPRVRYEAASAIARLAPETPFPGSSQIERRFAEMRMLGDLPTAIVVETRPDMILRLETLLSQMGYRVKVVPSVRGLMREVVAGGDLRLVLSKTNLADVPPIELVDRVRRSDLGNELPIAFYGDRSAVIGADRWQAPTMQIDPPASPPGLAGVMEQIERRRQLPPLSGIDRRLYRDAAPEVPSFVPALGS